MKLLDGMGRRLVESGLFWMTVFALCATLLFSAPAVLLAANQPERSLPIYCVQTDQPQIALTFDAAWGNEDLPRILDILASHQIRATFFMTGDWIEAYPESVRALAAAGHDLGNHGDTHAHMTELTAAQMAQEIRRAHEKVQEQTGLSMDLFRPPYGDYNDTVIQTAADCGYYAIQWDVDSLDWKDYGADAIVKTVCEHPHLGNGSIILLHNGATYTAQALEALIQGLLSQGYEIVPVSELIYRSGYQIDHEGRQSPTTRNPSLQ